MNVTTYYRFSKHEQAEGTSIQRQREDCTEYAARNGWIITEELIDEARSAFTGANREIGSALYGFEEEVRLGLRHGSILLVERVDRLSREGYDETSDFVKLCMRNGVTIAVVDGSEYYEAGTRLDVLQVIKLLIKAEVAHEESVKKSQRGKRRYDLDRATARATGAAMGKNLPGWLEVGPDGKARVRGDRDAVVRRVFQLADDGVGSLQIVQTVNREFEPWQPLNGSKAAKWNRSRITRLLSDRQVTGEYQPRSKVNGKSVANGDPWPDHLPRIIAQDQFDRVRDAASARQTPAGKRSTVVGNLFAGKLSCVHCGSWMLFERKRPAGSQYQNGKYVLKHDEAILRCSNERFGKVCTNTATVSYFGFEKAMLDTCLHLALDDRSFADRENLGLMMSKLAEARRTHDIAETSARSLWTSFARRPSDMAETIAHEAEAEAKRLVGEIEMLSEEVTRASGKADAEAHMSRINGYREFLYDPDLEVRARHRNKVAVALRSIIREITFDNQRVARVALVGNTQVFSILKGKPSWRFNLHKASKDSTPAELAVERRLKEAA
ncbi:DNA invertase Pin-like site-specific DNA recombinase [Sphingomonas faeni]|uniref:DNA invertase Pin-like site-specific DNA recombinase n=1 Tax=Sphingomonas faeni TaxID=185950 RepID=A0A2T5UCG9_9SPHN|nr:recombinase family protein [Sphingomonas faeni]PTW49198.1 DNA invertase Pin-like site-specific DNA recombinase [Sphingomonas faeni]